MNEIDSRESQKRYIWLAQSHSIYHLNSPARSIVSTFSIGYDWLDTRREGTACRSLEEALGVCRRTVEEKKCRASMQLIANLGPNRNTSIRKVGGQLCGGVNGDALDKRSQTERTSFRA